MLKSFKVPAHDDRMIESIELIPANLESVDARNSEEIYTDSTSS